MAMLVLPDVFERTWGGSAPAVLGPCDRAGSRGSARVSRFMAEVYWDLEWTMLQLGFDYAYDKRLYDRLATGLARPVREHLSRRSRLPGPPRAVPREPRRATRRGRLPVDQHEAAALITFLTPGLRFFHEGQLEGHRVRISPHLIRGPAEPTDARLAAFYDALLGVLRLPVVRNGDWRLLECSAAWDGNPTADGFVAFTWSMGDTRLVVVVNYAATQAQCRVHLAMDEVRGTSVRLHDQIGDQVFDRDGDDLATNGLYVDLPRWGSHVLAFTVMSQMEARPQP